MEYDCLCDKFTNFFDTPPKDADGNEIDTFKFSQDNTIRTRKGWYAWFAWYPVRLEDGKCIWLEKVNRQDTWWSQGHWGGMDHYNVVEYKRYSKE